MRVKMLAPSIDGSLHSSDDGMGLHPCVYVCVCVCVCSLHSSDDGMGLHFYSFNF